MNHFKKIQIKIRPYKEFLREMLSKIGFKCNTVFIIRGDVERELPVVVSNPSVQTMIATLEQVDWLRISDAKERLGRNDLCFVVLFEGKMAGYAWLNISKKAYIPELEEELPLDRGEAYQYDALIYPQFRRNNLHKMLITSRLEYLKKHGFKSVYGFISADNTVSLKSVNSFGYVAIKKIRFLRIFWLRKRWELPVSEEYVS